MVNSCGLNAWACNSQVVHATSPTLSQRFSRVAAVRFGGRDRDHDAGVSAADDSPVQPRFAHEPNVVRGPAGEWVMFWTGGGPGTPGAIPIRGQSRVRILNQPTAPFLPRIAEVG